MKDDGNYGVNATVARRLGLIKIRRYLPKEQHLHNGLILETSGGYMTTAMDMADDQHMLDELSKRK